MSKRGLRKLYASSPSDRAVGQSAKVVSEYRQGKLTGGKRVLLSEGREFGYDHPIASGSEARIEPKRVSAGATHRRIDYSVLVLSVANIVACGHSERGATKAAMANNPRPETPMAAGGTMSNIVWPKSSSFSRITAQYFSGTSRRLAIEAMSS
jgi:hypothetical protein